MRAEDRAAHDWYRFVLSYPPHLVRGYADKFGLKLGSRVLDPFCGTGTTLVECKKNGVPSVGVESNPMPCFASRVKTDWSGDSSEVRRVARTVAQRTMDRLKEQGFAEHAELPLFREHQRALCEALLGLPHEVEPLLLKNSISPLPLHKTLVLIDEINQASDVSVVGYLRLALAKALVSSIGNLRFGPEVGLGPIRTDAPVIASWLRCIDEIADDLSQLHDKNDAPCVVHLADSRALTGLLEPQSVDAVITSPPYPNEKDYTRTTRLESVLLGFIRSRQDLQAVKKGLVRSNTRGVYRGDDDDELIRDNATVNRIAEEIEKRRKRLGKTSGFERMYAKVTRLYFGGMARHLSDLRNLLKPGAHLAYVVGDQASYLRVMIRTGRILADVARSLGYELLSVDLFRTRLATATGEQLREEVVILRWSS